MSPIDDELRRTMRERADVLLPAADPLSGIEDRARRLTRRRRTVGAFAGAVVLAAGVAIALPQLDSGTGAATVEQLSSPSPSPAPSTAPAADPINLLTWELRGSVPSGPPEDEVRAAYAHAVGVEPELESVHYRPLYAGGGSGVLMTVGQAWLSGDTKAHTFGYATRGTNGPLVFLGPETPDKPPAIAFLVDSLPGATTDLLVVVPRPGTGQVSYSPDATTAFAPVASGRSDLDPLAFIDRSTRADRDRLQVLDGDGDLDHPLYEGPVQPLLCAAKECG